MAKYDEDGWRAVVRRARPRGLLGKLMRLVENQEQVVTLNLVDDLAEHDVLEALLESSKPPLEAELRRFDYLLRSPWRYPPLPWGSRFGRRFEPGLFYGSLTINGLLAEAAYYRLVFLNGMERPFQDRVISQHTAFEARYQTDNGLELQHAPFRRHAEVLQHKSDYRATQALGTVLRERGVAAFTYVSARAREAELNIALLKPQALRSRKHLNPVRVIAETRSDNVQFRHAGTVYRFEREQFLVGRRLPLPAA